MPFNPAYRARIYAPRSVDSTEATVLTPQGGSPSHTDNCQVATMTGVSGYKNYLDLPGGRKSTLDMLRRKIKPGGITLTILDPRMTAGGSNATRWFSEYFAYAVGVSKLMGLRVEVDITEHVSVLWFGHAMNLEWKF